MHNDRPTLSLPRPRPKFEVRPGGNKPFNKGPRTPKGPKGHQARLLAAVGKEVTVYMLSGNIFTGKLIEADAFTLTLDLSTHPSCAPGTEAEFVVFKHGIATMSLPKLEAVPANV